MGFWDYAKSAARVGAAISTGGLSEAAIAAANKDPKGALTNAAAGGYGSGIMTGVSEAKKNDLLPSAATASAPNAGFSSTGTPGRDVAPGEVAMTLPTFGKGTQTITNNTGQTVNVGATPAVTPEQSMLLGQRNVQNYQPGVSMSQPLQNLANSGQARGAEAQSTLGGYGQSAAGYGQTAANYGNVGLSFGAQGAGYGMQAAGYGAGAADLGQAGVAAGQAGNAFAQGTAGQLTGVGQTAAGMGAGYAGQLAGAGASSANIGNAYGNQVANVGGQAGGLAQSGMSSANMSRVGMMQNASNLAGLEQQQGPSGAQAQLNLAMGQGMANNIALSRSGRGFGQSSAQEAEALRANSVMGAQAADQSAMLKASEDAAWRQRQANNFAAAGGLQGQAGGLGLNASQVGLQGNAQTVNALTSAGQLGLAGQSQNIGALSNAGQVGLAGLNQQSQNLANAGQLGLAGTNAELAGIQAGQQGYATGIQGASAGMQGAQVGIQGVNTAMQGQQVGMQGAQVGGNLAATGYGLGYQGDQQAGQSIAQDQAAKQSYENLLTQQQGIQAGIAVQNAASQNAFTGGMMQMAGAALPVIAMASDVRTKENIVSMEDQAAQADKAAQGRADAMRGYGGKPVVGPSGPGFEAGQRMRAEAERKQMHDDAYQRGLQKGLAQFGQQAGAAMGGAMQSGGAPQIQMPGPSYRDPGVYGQFGGGGYGMQASDERVKDTDKEEDNPAVEAIDHAPGYSYSYKDPARFGYGMKVGPMAQDLESTPAGRTVIGQTPDGVKTIDTGRLTLLQTAALHSLSKRLKKLEARR